MTGWLLDAPLSDRLAWCASLRPIDPDGWEGAAGEVLRNVPEKRSRRTRKPSLKTIIRQARAAGARSVVTPDGVRIEIGEDQEKVEPLDDLDRELAEWEARHAGNA